MFIDYLEYFYSMSTAREIALEKENIELKSKVNSLQNQLEAILKIMLGKKSEKRTDPFANQPSLFGDDIPLNKPEEAEKEQVSYSRKKRKGNPVRKPLPESLRREIVEIFPAKIPDGAIRIGEVATEVLEIIAAEIYVKRYVRYKYALPKEEGVIIGEMPLLPIHKSNASASILAYLIIAKFLDHLPWYRQIQQFKRQGIELSDSTINNWFKGASELLKPLYEIMVEIILSSNYLQIDESTIPVRDPAKKGDTHTGYFWVYHSPPDNVVIFDYQRGRASKFPKAFLKDFQGHLQTDGYGAYNFIERDQELIHYACMAHARRKFFEAIKNDKKRSEEMLDLIGELYVIEKQARESMMNISQRYDLRQEKAKPIMLEIKKWLDENVYKVVPDSKIGKAIQYMLGQWTKLDRYTENGLVEIDNNLTENKIRLLALGRKNYLFSGNHNAAQNAAMMYSFLGTCKANNINPAQWLPNAIAKLPYCKTQEDYIALLPQNFKGV